MSDSSDALASAAGLEVRPLRALSELRSAAQLLDRAERWRWIPLVDEAERARLEQAVQGALVPQSDGWWPALAWRDQQLVGYVAVTVRGDRAVGDAADLENPVHTDVEMLRVLLEAARALAEQAGAAERLQVWTRRAGRRHIEVAGEIGFALDRRLGVLGRPLDEELPGPPRTPAARIRALRLDDDEADVVGVLAAAYASTDDAGWDLDAFRARTRLPWFRAEDLLVAERDTSSGGPRLGGLHWLKRRDANTGEVYNLAVHPDAQGEGLGPALLHAGLAHLREQGMRDVILWVDLANDRAVRLYESQGFETRWLDLALERRG